MNIMMIVEQKRLSLLNSYQFYPYSCFFYTIPNSLFREISNADAVVQHT